MVYSYNCYARWKAPAISYEQWKENEMKVYNRIKKIFDKKNEIHELQNVIVSRDTPIKVIEDIESKPNFIKWIKN